MFITYFAVEAGKPRERYVERLRLQFKQLNRAQLEAHDAVVEKLRWAKKHRKNIAKDYLRHRKAMNEAAQALLAKEMDQAIEEMNKQLGYMKQQQRSDRIKQEMYSQLPNYAEKLAAKREADDQARHQLTQQEQAKQRAREQYLHSLKTKAQECNELKRQTKHAQQLEKQRKAQEERDTLRQTVRQNLPKVARRQEESSKRMAERLEKAELDKQEHWQREQRIQKAVEGYAHVPHPEVDPERVRQQTKSLQAKKQKMDKADQVDMYKLTGFTADNLMKDMRYRLSHYLAQAGLGQSEYGRKLVQVAPPAKAPRRDATSTYNIVQ